MLMIGDTHTFNHSRKGTFSGKVISQDSEWITVEITSGRADAMMSYNVAQVGDEVTIRKSHLISVDGVHTNGEF